MTQIPDGTTKWEMKFLHDVWVIHDAIRAATACRQPIETEAEIAEQTKLTRNRVKECIRRVRDRLGANEVVPCDEGSWLEDQHGEPFMLGYGVPAGEPEGTRAAWYSSHTHPEVAEWIHEHLMDVGRGILDKAGRIRAATVREPRLKPSGPKLTMEVTSTMKAIARDATVTQRQIKSNRSALRLEEKGQGQSMKSRQRAAVRARKSQGW